MEWRVIAVEIREARGLEERVSKVFHHVYTDIIIKVKYTYIYKCVYIYALSTDKRDLRRDEVENKQWRER